MDGDLLIFLPLLPLALLMYFHYRAEERRRRRIARYLEWEEKMAAEEKQRNRFGSIPPF